MRNDHSCDFKFCWGFVAKRNLPVRASARAANKSIIADTCNEVVVRSQEAEGKDEVVG